MSEYHKGRRHSFADAAYSGNFLLTVSRCRDAIDRAILPDLVQVECAGAEQRTRGSRADEQLPEPRTESLAPFYAANFHANPYPLYRRIMVARNIAYGCGAPESAQRTVHDTTGARSFAASKDPIE